MHPKKSSRPRSAKLALAILSCTLVLPMWEGSNAYADPPPWAPAHGYRNKHHDDRDEDRDDDHDREHDGEWRRERRTVYRDTIVTQPQTTYSIPYGIDQGTCNRTLLGQVLGGATGAALGSTIGKGNGGTVAIVGGGILGAIVGGNIGQSMDRVDQNCVGQVLEHAPDGRQVAWVDPKGGARYQITPDRPYQNQQGQYCRKYLTDAVINGRNQQVTGLACRQPNGTWQMVN